MTQATRPSVTVSYAQTLDGRLATRHGRSQWISGPESLKFSHALRAQHDAIMVGVGTVCADNPRLTVRLVDGRDPLRVVVDSALRTPLNAAVLADGAPSRTLLAVTEHASAARIKQVEALGAGVLILPTDAAMHVDLRALLLALHTRGITSVMVEGGAQLITSLLRAQLVDRLAVCIAPKILGTGIAAVGDLGIDVLDNALTLPDMQLARYGVDMIVSGTIRYGEQGTFDAVS